MQKNTRTTDEKYICPPKAVHKLKSAHKFRTPLYLYGVTGIGKTALILHNLNMKKCSYYSAAKIQVEQLIVKVQTTEQIVVIDDLQEVTDALERNAYFQKIQEFLAQDSVWLILIARCPFPRWLLPLRGKYIFEEIPEEDFLLTLEEQKAYVSQYGLYLTDEQHRAAWNVGGGNPMSLVFYVMEKGDLDRTLKRQWDFLEMHVYEQWDVELQEFFMDISIVEFFTMKLASMLTGRSDVEQLIARAEETGNFFEIRGDAGIWKCRWAMRQSMKQRLHRKRTTEQIKRLYYTAGLYYELDNQVLKALTMYEEYNDMDSISRLLISNARKNPSGGHYYELRRYYMALSEDVIEKSPILMASMSLLQSMLMNIEDSERWYQKLEAYAKNHSGSQKKEAQSRLIYLRIALPHRGLADMPALLEEARLLIKERQIVLPELSATSNLPSIMNGGKDLCEWLQYDKKELTHIGKCAEFVLGRYGRGLVSMLVAEYYFETGKDIFEIFSHVEKGKMEADSGGKLEQIFVGTGILAWLSVMKNDVEGALTTLFAFRDRACKEAPNLLQNIDAFICRVRLYTGDDGLEWLQKAPDEHKEFCGLDRFGYLTKVRVYIRLEKFEAAYCLVQQILYYTEVMQRTYIHMEATLLLTLIQYCTGQEKWKDNLQKCISQAEQYELVRLFTREGPVLAQIFEKEQFEWKNENFKQQVLEEVNQMQDFYPQYLNDHQTSYPALSENAVKILKLQSQGLSSAAIAEKMNLSEATVKYHCRENYRKLGVNNKTAAIAEARKRKLI